MGRFHNFVLAIAALGLGALPFSALADPARSFVDSDGFAALDPDAVWDEINATLAPTDPSQTVFLPTADIGPIPMAALAIQAREPALERVRYRVLHGVNWVQGTPGGALTPVSYTEIVRFNLGPAIWQDLVEILGEDDVAPLEAFGVGPHVAYRIVTQPLMGNAAIPVTVGRKEISEQDAAEMSCLGENCLMSYSAFDLMVPWSEIEETPYSPDTPYSAVEGGVITPVGMADHLLGSVELEPMDGLASGQSAPAMDIELVIDEDLGQDMGVDAAYRWGGLMDDSVRAIWKRAASFSFGGEGATTLYEAVAYECARGPDFAEPGSFCP